MQPLQTGKLCNFDKKLRKVATLEWFYYINENANTFDIE